MCNGKLCGSSMPVMGILFSLRKDAMLAAYLMILGSGVVVLYSVPQLQMRYFEGTSLINKPIKNAFISLIMYILLYCIYYYLHLNQM